LSYLSERADRKNGLAPKLPTKKERKPLKRSVIKSSASGKVNSKRNDAFFRSKKLEMKGICANCGGKTGANDDKFYKHCISHILPKRDNMFPSIADNDLNWIELCFWGNSCHAKYDSSFEMASKMRIWPIVIDRIKKLYPILTEKEQAIIRNIDAIWKNFEQ
jgi:hypothetical protein